MLHPGPCPYERDEVCRVKRIIDAAGKIIDAVDYTPAIRVIALQWKESDRPNARISVYGERDEAFCQCLLDYAMVEALSWLKRAEGPSSEEVAHIAQAIANALGPQRRALVELSAPRPPPWLPVRILAGTKTNGQESGRWGGSSIMTDAAS
jgi:hypothetical protein